MSHPGEIVERCAAALSRPAPVDVDDVVRVLVDGSAALGLSELAGPWRHDLDVAGRGRHHFDEVARALVALPRRLPVVLYVSGPVWVAASSSSNGTYDQDQLDDAVDLVAARIRTLAAIRPDRIAALEPQGEHTEGPELEAHQTIRRVAAHFGIPFTIEQTGED